MSYLTLIYLPLLTFVTVAPAWADETDFRKGIENKAKEQVHAKCEEFTVKEEFCNAFITSFFDAAAETDNVDQFTDVLGDKLEANILKSDTILTELVINSGIVGARLKNSPLSLKFKAMDLENDDTVMGLEFAYKKEFSRNNLKPSETMHRYWTVDLNVSGTVTQNAEENPRNFVEAKVNALGGMYTKIPVGPDQLDQAITEIAYKLLEGENINDPAIWAEFTPALDSITHPLGGHTYIRYGLVAGYEADQKFKAKNSTISATVFAQYEAWNKNTFLGQTGIVPSVRISVDQVAPNNETLRAKAGDDTSYSRFSGEISLWAPLNQMFESQVALTFNYRTYQELKPSDMVKNANLDRYHLRTYSLTGPNGIYVSYSSGRLPFDLESQQIIELGFKTHF